VSDSDEPVGYVIVDLVDGNAHVEQVSVQPNHQGTGVGRALLEQVQVWAAEVGAPVITLTTFVGVPWNAPLYAHLGFTVMTAEDIGPELAAIVEAEVAHGLDRSQRVCMQRQVAN
jgi:GNAT superfamily N-acetyltransferase